MTRDFIKRESELIVIDENGDSHSIKLSDENKLVWDDDIDTSIYNWAIKNTEYEGTILEPDEIEWPIDVEYSFHLEDTLGLHSIPEKLEKYMGYTGHEYFRERMDGRPNYPSISLNTVWEVESDGTVKLSHIEYNGEKFTRD